MQQKKLREMTDEELNAYYRAQKIRKDAKELKAYRKRMENTVKNYGQKFEAIAINQRKSRELALGACALKALDAARELMRVKNLKPGSLDFMISESPVQDETGKKAFHCSVIFSVTSYEPAYTQEEIQKEIEETFEKMMRETDVLYPKEWKHEEKESVQDPEGDHE